ncbi:MAG: YaaC family protein, partial [Sphaerochaetaceae bacterium]|nr:YaaC family protein [Sphaerochaetaceae bacterium]
YSVTRSQYLLLSQKIREAGIWYFLSKDGYTIYLSARADYRYSPEFIIYTIMFFLGSITRYHPYLFDDILDKDDQWIVSEFLGTQPKQFLYLTTSKVFGLELREPYAKF